MDVTHFVFHVKNCIRDCSTCMLLLGSLSRISVLWPWQVYEEHEQNILSSEQHRAKFCIHFAENNELTRSSNKVNSQKGVSSDSVRTNTSACYWNSLNSLRVRLLTKFYTLVRWKREVRILLSVQVSTHV